MQPGGIFTAWEERDLETLSFEKIAPYLGDPLVLVGFALLLFFGLARALLKGRLLTPINGAKSYRVLQTILLYGFVLGILVVALGFGLKYRELSVAEQRNAVALLKGEFNANVNAVESMRRNTVTLLTVVQQTAHAVRQRDIVALSTLFPARNVAGGSQPHPRELALDALSELLDKKLDKDRVQMQRADAAAKVIRGTIERTRSTVISLSDSEHQRYVVRDDAWQANASILSKVMLGGIPEFQDSYAAMRRLRSDYDVVCASVVAYLDALYALFDVKVGVDVNTLTAALSQERQSVSLVTAYGTSLTDAMARIQKIQASLNHIDRPPG